MLGWLKTIALMRKVRHRGFFKVGWVFTFAAAACNLGRRRTFSVIMDNQRNSLTGGNYYPWNMDGFSARDVPLTRKDVTYPQLAVMGASARHVASWWGVESYFYKEGYSREISKRSTRSRTKETADHRS
jgi:hypothetical protein